MHDIGGEQAYQEKLAEPDPTFWTERWVRFEQRLRIAAHLDEECELSSAVKRYSQVKLNHKSNVHEASRFLGEYLGARADMLEQGLLSDSDPKALMREVEDFKSKIETTEMLKYLLELPEFPKRTEAPSGAPEGEHKTTILGRCRQYVRANGGAASKGTGTSGAEAGSGSSLSFGPKTRKQKKEEKNKEEEKKKADKTKSVVDAVDALLALGDRRAQALRSPGKGGRGDGGKGQPGGGQPGTRAVCDRCKGRHPECSECPNGPASRDATFNTQQASKELTYCFYRHCGRPKCNGYGHRVKDHIAALSESGKKEWEEDRRKYIERIEREGGGKGKGKGKGKGNKCKGNKGASRLDMSESHADDDGAARRTAAERLMAALLKQDFEELDTCENYETVNKNNVNEKPNRNCVKVFDPDQGMVVQVPSQATQVQGSIPGNEQADTGTDGVEEDVECVPCFKREDCRCVACGDLVPYSRTDRCAGCGGDPTCFDCLTGWGLCWKCLRYGPDACPDGKANQEGFDLRPGGCEDPSEHGFRCGLKGGTGPEPAGEVKPGVDDGIGASTLFVQIVLFLMSSLRFMFKSVRKAGAMVSRLVGWILMVSLIVGVCSGARVPATVCYRGHELDLASRGLLRDTLVGALGLSPSAPDNGKKNGFAKMRS